MHKCNLSTGSSNVPSLWTYVKNVDVFIQWQEPSQNLMQQDFAIPLNQSLESVWARNELAICLFLSFWYRSTFLNQGISELFIVLLPICTQPLQNGALFRTYGALLQHSMMHIVNKDLYNGNNCRTQKCSSPFERLILLSRHL